MGSTRNFKPTPGHNAEPTEIKSVTLTCGCGTVEPPALSKPDKWWCCGGWQKAKR